MFQRPILRREVTGVIAVFVLYFLGSGILIPFLPIWLSDRNLSTAEISVVLALPMIARVVAAPLFGYLGDRFSRRAVVLSMTLVSVLMALVLSIEHSYLTVVVLVPLVYICWQATPVQMDSIVIDLLKAKLIGSYGSVRVFGSCAFIAANVLGGVILASWGSDGILLAVIGIGTALFVVVLLALGGGRDQAARPETDTAESGGRITLAIVLVLSAAATLHATHSTFMAFGGLHMRNLAFSDPLIGIVLATATLSEIVAFAVGFILSKRLAPLTMLTIAAICAIIRWVLTAYLVSPLALFLLQASHAVSFGFAFLGMTGFVAQAVGSRYVGRTQGLYLAILSASSAAMVVTFGSAYTLLEGRAFLISALIALSSLVFVVWARLIGAPNQRTEVHPDEHQ